MIQESAAANASGNEEKDDCKIRKVIQKKN